MDVEKVFANVTGRKMTPDEVTRYLKFQKEFEVPDTDPTWMIFVWFEFYQRIFEQLPSSMRAEAEVITRQVKEASAAVTSATATEVKAAREKAALEITNLREKSVIEINEMKEKAKGDIVKALGITLTTEIGKAVDKLAMKSTAKKWLSIGLVSGGLLITVVNAWTDWSVWKKGEGTGLARGIPIIRSLNHFVSCDLPGWKIEKDKDGGETCYPHADKAGNQYGWRIR